MFGSVEVLVRSETPRNEGPVFRSAFVTRDVLNLGSDRPARVESLHVLCRQ